LRTAASINPVAEDAAIYPGRCVRKIDFNPGCTRAISASMSFARWAIIGPTCACNTSGRTSVGPGRKNLPNGGSSGIVTLCRLRSPIATFVFVAHANVQQT